MHATANHRTSDSHDGDLFRKMCLLVLSVSVRKGKGKTYLERQHLDISVDSRQIDAARGAS